MLGKLIDAMLDYRAVGYGILLLAFSGGYFFGALNTTKAAPKNEAQYRVVGSYNESTLAKEMNQLAAEGCRPLFSVGASSNSEGMVVMECP